MSPRQEIMAILLSVGLMVLIFELVRRRSLKEEYSWLWMLTGVTIFILALSIGEVPAQSKDSYQQSESED